MVTEIKDKVPAVGGEAFRAARFGAGVSFTTAPLQLPAYAVRFAEVGN